MLGKIRFASSRSRGCQILTKHYTERPSSVGWKLLKLYWEGTMHKNANFVNFSGQHAHQIDYHGKTHWYVKTSCKRLIIAGCIISLFHKVKHLLLTNPYVIVIALDFSKALDTVRHHTLIDKMAQLDLPDYVHNWLVHFFEAHSHQTKYQDEVSVMKTISASIVQGSTIGPASYVVNSFDLNAISEGNALCKYADDTYVIIPAVTCSDELNHISDWAHPNSKKFSESMRWKFLALL